MVDGQIPAQLIAALLEEQRRKLPGYPAPGPVRMAPTGPNDYSAAEAGSGQYAPQPYAGPAAVAPPGGMMAPTGPGGMPSPIPGTPGQPEQRPGFPPLFQHPGHPPHPAFPTQASAQGQAHHHVFGAGPGPTVPPHVGEGGDGEDAVHHRMPPIHQDTLALLGQAFLNQRKHGIQPMPFGR